MPEALSLSRRFFVAGTIGAFATPTHVFGEESRSLKAAAATKGILFGSAVGTGKAESLTGSFADPAYLDILSRSVRCLSRRTS